MEDKYLFVCEYNASYTGGSRVFISTEKELPGMAGDSEKLMTDKDNCLKYELSNGNIFIGIKRDDSYCGIAKEGFISRVKSSNFPDKFKKLVLNCAENPEYQSGEYVRLDWLVHWGIGEPEDGLYIVYKTKVDDKERSRLISDTYYCA